MHEERIAARDDRQRLLSQITDLIDADGQARELRWQTKLSAVKEDVSSSRSKLDSSEKSYSDAMDAWSKKEALLVDEVLKSRESLKLKMKEDWKAINEHNNSIQTTTKSVHEETIRIVDAQMEDMAKQMQALDDFVTRARSQNERHHRTHVDSLQGLASNVSQSYSNIGDHFVSTYDRVKEVGADIDSQSKEVQATLPSLDTSLKDPLATLRSQISRAPLKEYTPTGETPQKTQYQYPTDLPQTTVQSKSDGARQPQPFSPASPQSASKSPTKGVIYTDQPQAESDLRPGSASPSKSMDGMGLREISLNVNAALNRNASDSAVPQSIKGKSDIDLIRMAPPPLKRQATESKLPTKLGGGRTGVVRIEGRENMAPGRRLRSSPVD